jgi:hypothetical protein
MHFEMEDLIEQANEVQESMSRTYGVPDEVDEADLEAGAILPPSVLPFSTDAVVFILELDALGDDLAEEDEGIPSYLREEASELPDFVDEPPVLETVRFSYRRLLRLGPALTFPCDADAEAEDGRGGDLVGRSFGRAFRNVRIAVHAALSSP